ncbi:DUF58 domain-containing protein [Methanogenium sp. S4BF]|uniref:DUF58 domain-containing protein n=1 Tax=Methanogenium sp. S4BF TaxID=1789226 RepID=UPI002417F4A5|nr:DUF58 domain-containing protein [Methanogenium sp. S4BF]WFN34527.1 DUF58 domain-containing protein [Methanogenium sp. S4BF]
MKNAKKERVSALSGYSAEECLKSVRQIRIVTRAYAQRNQTGMHTSLSRSQGIDLADIREYVYGDDIRSMDWNITARTGKPHVRVYHEEQERTVYLVIDRSASSSFGADVSKDVKILEVAATIIYSVLKDGDAAGVLLFTGTAEKYIPARKGKNHAASVINTIISHTPRSPETDIGMAAEFLLGRLKRKSRIIIISDFDSPSFEDAVALLKRRHDVQAIRVSDGHETEIPDVGPIELIDPETGEQLLIDTSDRIFREHYRRIAEAHEERLTGFFRKNRIPALPVDTSDPYRDVFFKLQTFFGGAA